MSRKKHGNSGVPKSHYHRERIRASMRAFWKRTHEALAAIEKREQVGQ